MKILNMIKNIITLDFVKSRIERYLANNPNNIVYATGRKVDNFLYPFDFLFWIDWEWIEEREHAFVDSSDDKRDKARLILLRGLVLSYLPDDVHCGVTILQDLLLRAHTPKQKKKAMHLLAIGHYRIGNFSKSMDYVSRCLEIKPHSRCTIDVGVLIYRRMKKERRRNLLMASAMAIGLVTGLVGHTTLLVGPTWVMEALTFKFLTKKGVKKVVTGSLPDSSKPLQMHEEMYLLAHRYFIRERFEDMPRCNYLIDRCLEIAPEWKPAMTLKRRLKYVRMKAYINELVYEGIAWAAGGIFSVSLLKWAGI